VGKPEGKRPLERPRCRWEDGIKMHLREIGWGEGGVEWIHLAQDRDHWQALMSAVMNLQVLAPRSQSVILSFCVGKGNLIAELFTFVCLCVHVYTYICVCVCEFLSWSINSVHFMEC
jgi:hypothetical protein